MAYSEELAERVREVLVPHGSAVAEIKMFGGLCYTIHGNMCVGIVDDDLMVRVGPDAHQDALTRPHAREMDFTGRSMKGMVFVGPGGTDDDTELELWVRLGAAYAAGLPPKRGSSASGRASRAKGAATRKKTPKKPRAARKR